MVSSNVVRIVNLDENQNEYLLKLYIQQRVELSGKIKKIYVRKQKKIKLVYAYIIFEVNSDAVNTVEKLDGTLCGELTLDVALIGPNEKCKLYDEEQRKFQEMLLFDEINIADELSDTDDYQREFLLSDDDLTSSSRTLPQRTGNKRKLNEPFFTRGFPKRKRSRTS